MYSMHKYWSRKPSQIVRQFIERYTKEGDVVLDPFCGSAVTACEAVRLGRRAIGIDLNPMAAFIAKVTLRPVNLPRLRWAFEDIRNACEATISELFATRCPRCGGAGSIDFVIREYDKPVQIAYTCSCSKRRLFKDPDVQDKHLDDATAGMEVPYWYPEDVPLPTIQKERFTYLHELFTRRNLIALSTILHSIDALGNSEAGDVMRLAFTSALDKCSRLKPLSKQTHSDRHSLSESWIAVRFYAPRQWEEVNPWKAYDRAFARVYDGKRESNAKMPNAVIGSTYRELKSGNVNVVLFSGSAEKVLIDELPEHCIDYVFTDPPFASAIQYMALSTFWGAWLGFHFDYGSEIVVDRRRGKTDDEYNNRMRSVFQALASRTKKGRYIHILLHDIRGHYLHNLVRSLEEAEIKTESIIHQPPPSSFGYAARVRTGYYGSYVIRAKVSGFGLRRGPPVSEDDLRQMVAQAARDVLSLRRRNGKANMGTILHAVYQRLDSRGISRFAQYDAERFVSASVSQFAEVRNGEFKILETNQGTFPQHDAETELRRAILDAESVLEGEKDCKNRVRQLVLRRLQSDFITLEDVSLVQTSIKEWESKQHRRVRFGELLCEFGRELGFVTRCLHAESLRVTWSKADTLGCVFEIRESDILCSTPRSPSDKSTFSEWGTVSFMDLELALLEWCRKHPGRGDEVRLHLNPLEGPSYAPTARQSNGLRFPHHLKLKVLQNREVCPKHRLLQLRIPAGVDPMPGQFFHILCDPDNGDQRGYPLTLRRPFAIHGAQYVNFERKLLARSGDIPQEIRNIMFRHPVAIDFLYKIVGEGTSSLREINEDTVLDAIGPLGNGFRIKRDCPAVIVAGGIGVAPLVALAEHLRYLDQDVYIYFGALRKDLLTLALSRPDSTVDFGFANGTQEFLSLIREEFQEIGTKDVRICTDDGSAGETGLVADILKRDITHGRLPQGDICIYACGPYAMLRSVSSIAEQYKLDCQVLLEERMACGVGACLSCVCEIIGESGVVEKKRVCRDGPVFRASEIKWKDYPQK